MPAAPLPESLPELSLPSVQPPSFVARAMQIPLRRWPLLLVALLVSLGVAAAAGRMLGSTIWQLEGTMVYNNLALSDVQRGIYSPPSFQTVTSIVNTTNNMEDLRKEFGLALPAEVLARLFKVKVQDSADDHTIRIALNWEDGPRGEELVNRLMELNVQHLTKERQATVARYQESIDAAMAVCEQRLAKARSDLDNLNLPTTVQNFKVETERLEKEVSDLSNTLATQQQEEQAYQDRVGASKKRIDDMKEKARQDATNANAEPSDEERKAEEDYDKMKVKLEAAKRRYNEERPLAEQKIISAKDFQKTKEEYDVLQAEAKVLQRKIEFERQRRKKGTNNPILQQEEAKLLDLNDHLKDARGKVALTTRTLEERRKKAHELTRIQKQVEPLIEKLKGADADRLQLEAQQLAARQLANRSDAELSIHARAKASDSSSSSTQGKFAAIGLILTLALSLGLLVGAEMVGKSWQIESLAYRLGLPILARFTRHRIEESANTINARALALRLRQYLPETGAIALLSPTNEGKDFDDVICSLARFLAIRDEKILILDARIASGSVDAVPRLTRKLSPSRRRSSPGMDLSQPLAVEPIVAGLVQYLVFEGQKERDFVYQTALHAVDYMPAGGPYPVTDVLASQPMKELLDSLRSRYTMLLIVGPALRSTVDTELLAAYADGSVLVLNGQIQGVGATVETLVRSLKEANAPLLGSVIAL